MKNDLTCGVVRDLLPSYVENLLGEESREAVDRHLEGCPECTAQKDAMAAQAAETEETAKEVDYLRKVKKRSAKRIALAVVCTATVLAAALALKIFVIGTPLQAQSVAVIVAEAHPDNSLYLSLSSTGSGNAFHSWKVETSDDGVACIYARSVLVSPFCKTGNANIKVPLDFVREVWLGGTSGRLIWAEGLEISKSTLDLLGAKTPYCGDAPALGNIAKLLNISRAVGPYTTSIHTSSEPYTWTLEFQDKLDTRQWQQMRNYLIQMLALVENLDKAAYTYQPENASGRTAEERTRQGSVSVESASRLLVRLTEKYNKLHGTDWPVHESVKEYAESPLEYQRMVTLLSERLE